MVLNVYVLPRCFQKQTSWWDYSVQEYFLLWDAPIWEDGERDLEEDGWSDSQVKKRGRKIRRKYLRDFCAARGRFSKIIRESSNPSHPSEA
jgi:hypothetical protein